MATPLPVDHSRLLALQRTAGNQAVARMLAAGSARPVRASGRGRLQRVLDEFRGPEIGGKANVKSAGLKDLLQETDDGKLYFKSGRSSATDWVLIEVKLSQDGRNYERTGGERVVKAQKKVPKTAGDWGTLAYVSDDTMLYPDTRVPPRHDRPQTAGEGADRRGRVHHDALLPLQRRSVPQRVRADLRWLEARQAER